MDEIKISKEEYMRLKEIEKIHSKSNNYRPDLQEYISSKLQKYGYLENMYPQKYRAYSCVLFVAMLRFSTERGYKKIGNKSLTKEEFENLAQLIDEIIPG